LFNFKLKSFKGGFKVGHLNLLLLFCSYSRTLPALNNIGGFMKHSFRYPLVFLLALLFCISQLNAGQCQATTKKGNQCKRQAGIDTKGHPALRAYQTGGSSNSGNVPDWRLFHEADMANLSMLQTTFSSARDGYARGDPIFSTIHCQL